MEWSDLFSAGIYFKLNFHEVFVLRVSQAGRGEGQRPHGVLSNPLPPSSCCLPGVFRGGHDLLLRARLLLTDTVTMQVTARSTEELPVDVIMASVG